MIKLLRRFGFGNRKQPITIVSGLPRSGTSLMMSILSAGGLQVLTDNQRQPDTDNPKGYFEFERAKQLTQGDTDWLEHVDGKVVKIISALLMHLPDSFDYRVIFMRRNMNEIIESQRKMLVRRNEMGDNHDEEKLKQLYSDHLENVSRWFQSQENVRSIELNYNELVENPAENLDAIERFLYQSFNTNAAIEVVDPNLYRNRAQ